MWSSQISDSPAPTSGWWFSSVQKQEPRTDKAENLKQMRKKSLVETLPKALLDAHFRTWLNQTARPSTYHCVIRVDIEQIIESDVFRGHGEKEGVLLSLVLTSK